jgi:hypothetical protein
MITEDYVSFEVAKLLKDKGMDASCFNHYVQKNNNDGTSEAVTVCTLQMAMKWLRKIYGIDIVIEISDPSVKDRKYYCMIWDGNNNSYILDLFNTYDQAVEAALKYSLENLI